MALRTTLIPAALLFAACAAAPPPPPQAPSAKGADPCADIDPVKIEEAAKVDESAAVKAARVAALEQTIADVRDLLAHLPPPGQKPEPLAPGAKPDPEAEADDPEEQPVKPKRGRSKKNSGKGKNGPADDVIAIPTEPSSVAQAGNRARVRLPNELLFPVGGIRITRDGRRALKQLAALIVKTPSERIQVNGHTDSAPIVGGWIDNWQLSMERARAVVTYLIAHGVEPKRLVPSAFADTDPAEEGTTDVARARNRRMEILIEPTGKN